MSDIHQYEVDLHWISNTKGLLSNTDLPTRIEVATPPEFPNGMKEIWTP